MKLRDHKGFVRFWTASTTSNFGTYITTIALQVLVVVNMLAGFQHPDGFRMYCWD